MADTVTPKLGLTKPEVGASDNSWGGKVNTDFDLVDALFDTGPLLKVTKGGTGVGTSTGTGNVVLSTSPTLVTPALGTPSALIGTSITGTAAGLTAGNVTTNANLTGGVTSVGNAATVVTNANLTGAVTSTGNATVLGSFTSANLIAAITDETGTGNIVFANSPTLVTPDLGTPSAAVLTLATGLPLSTGVTGTLPVANGGTGTSTPSIVGSATVVVSGSWPNQTLTAVGSGFGDVAGPASSTDNAITRFDATTGKLIQNSLVTVADDGAITAPQVGSVIPFYYANQAAFPSASTYHGALAHSHADGAMFFAHGGAWLRLLDGAYTTTATAAGTTTLTASSSNAQFFTGTAAQTIVLPLASTLALGQTFNIHNNSTGDLTVNSSGSNLVVTITANTTCLITCILTSGTSAASFDADFTGFTSTLPIARGGTGASTLAGANIPVVNVANTFTGTQTFSGTSSTLAMVLTDTAEVATVSATAATGTINYDITTQSVLYFTTNASANFTVNFRASSGTSLNTAMTTGQSVTAAFLVTNGATAYYNNVVQVDGSTVTPKFQGGTAYAAGNASSIDVYMYTIIKTGNAAFTVFTSQTKFA